MLVYGDAERRVDPRAELRALAQRVPTLPARVDTLEARGQWTTVLIELGQLAQGLIDSEFHARKCDAASTVSHAALCATLQCARVLYAGDRSESLDRRLDILSRLPLPTEIACKLPEGFAFYALYPELVAAAAREVPADAKVIGIRSIGTTLACIVAAALGHSEPPVTVRPVGHPFQRTLALSPELERQLAAHRGAFAVVDEGPGLSGSSFGAVIDVLEQLGISRRRVHVLPSHDGPLGPQAAPHRQTRWRELQRHVVPFEALRSPEQGVLALPPVERWAEDLIGAPIAPARELSGGAWRADLFGDEARWPGSNVQQERRKLLVRTGSGPWLLKFAGLGRTGERKAERARQLHEAGLGVDTPGVQHGFLVQRWLEDHRPLPVAAVDRRALIAHLARYLAFRARHFPAESSAGASLHRLLEMARHNVTHRLGPDAARVLSGWDGKLARMAERERRIETDNRMHACEWLVGPAGELVKTDAVDHHRAHDLVGCQDLTWDLAGAELELGLSQEELERLTALLRNEDVGVDDDLLAFHRLAYPAFQLGAAVIAAQAIAASWPEEARRLELEAKRYERCFALRSC